MQSNNYSDSSSSDIFIIKQIKPVNNLTLKQALSIKHSVLNSLHSKVKSKNKKKKKKIKDKNKNKESKLKKEAKNQNLTPAGSSFNEKSKSIKGKNKKMTLCNGTKKKICNNNMGKMFQENKKAETEKNLSENKMLANHQDDTSKKLQKSIIKSCEQKNSLKPNSQPQNLIEDKNVKKENIKKRTDSSPAISPRRKKIKNDLISSSAVPSNTFEKKESISEDNLSVVEHLKIEDASNVIGSIEDSKFEELLVPSQLEIDFSLGQKDNNKENGSALMCSLYKKIVSDETKKQIELEQESYLNGKTFEKLLSNEDCEIFEKFFNLEDGVCKLFVRMLGRKKNWHRVSTLVYEDISEDLKKYCEVLESVNFFDTNIESEDFKTQLNLLTNPEIRKLCKLFNVFIKSQNSVKKDFLINALIMECSKQKSVLEIFQEKKATSRSDLLKSEIKNYLGMCIKINKETFKAFNKILILFSFPHYFDIEEKRFSNELFRCVKVYRNLIKFPKYSLSPCVVFQTRADFEEYETALMFLSAFEVAVSNKNHDEFIETVGVIKKRFLSILENEEYKKRFLSLPSFLKKFSAGTVYARILTKYCQTFKRKADQSDIVKTVNLLLQQNIFLPRKRGDWYEVLSIALESNRENNAAAEVIVTSLRDPNINEVQRLTLQLRGQGILKKKTYGVSDVLLREVLDDLCTISVQEPASIEIKGKAIEGNESGFKCVYVQNTEYGKKYLSVEERAISFYKTQGYTKGYHVEGYIIHSVFYLLFYDIIYGISPKGVYLSPFQEAPLDFYSASFYLNRREKIDEYLSEMLAWDNLKIETTLKGTYSKHYNTTCLISWNSDFTPEVFCEVIKCITMPVLVLIFQRLIQSFRVYRSGFPDLTLWNPETNKIKFVEVKSPNDKLSPAQRIWLNYLRSIGLSAEVCNVKNLSGKNYR